MWGHALDYDLYLAARDRRVERRVAVFLDEFVPFHPDYGYMGVAPPDSADHYYSVLRTLFDQVERSRGVQVVIAAHPRSNYEERTDYFGGRLTERGRTVELVRDADLVLAHTSTAINFAVLFEKPVIFVTTRGLRESYEGPIIEETASLLGKRVYDLDEEPAVDWDRELAADRARYESFRHRYIKTRGSAEKPFWEIVADALTV